MSAVGKSLALSSNGLDFERLMKLLASTPKEKIDRPKPKSKRKKKRAGG
jgi:hypothetical protein